MKWGVVYPGQGSQHVGMGRFLFEEFSLVRELFEEASDTIKVNLKKLCFEGSEAELALTENAQPCLLLVSTAVYKTLESLTPFQPKGAAGHSIGEYAALVCSGAMRFSDAITAVRKRGEFMQNAVPLGKGGMVAVMGLTPEQVEEVCEWALKESKKDGVLEPANFNAPGQIVLSGSQSLIEWVLKHFKTDLLKTPSRRVKFIPLKVSAPFHCSLMKPAEENMRPLLESMKFQAPAYPIFQNVSAQGETNPSILKENLIRQISSSVRWVECIESLKEHGLTHVVECGSGQVLSGLIKKSVGDDIAVLNVNDLKELKKAEEQINVGSAIASERKKV